MILIGGFEPIQNALIRFDAHQFGNGVGVEQEAAHSSILRPMSGLRSNFISIPTKGDARKNRTRLSLLASGFALDGPIDWRALSISCSTDCKRPWRRPSCRMLSSPCSRVSVTHIRYPAR